MLFYETQETTLHESHETASAAATWRTRAGRACRQSSAPPSHWVGEGGGIATARHRHRSQRPGDSANNAMASARTNG